MVRCWACWWRMESGSGAARWLRAMRRHPAARPRPPVAGATGWRILRCLRFRNPRRPRYRKSLRRFLLPSSLCRRLPSRNNPRLSLRSRWILLRLSLPQPRRRPEIREREMAWVGRRSRAVQGKGRAADTGHRPARAPEDKVARCGRPSRGTWHFRLTRHPKSCGVCPST